MDFNKLINEDKKKELEKIPNLEFFLKNPFKNSPSIYEAIEISEIFEVDLHPNFLFYWNELEASKLVDFLKFFLNNFEILDEIEIKVNLSEKIEEKEIYENLGIEHSFDLDKNSISIDRFNSEMLLVSLGIDIRKKENLSKESIISKIKKIIVFAKDNLNKTSVEILNSNCFIGLRDKAGTYIGSRMGRPEKAKMRKQFNDETRSHGLFPVGEEGGRLKNIVDVLNTVGFVNEEFRIYHCPKCNKKSIYSKCEVCGSKTVQKFFEKYTFKEQFKEEENTIYYEKTKLDMSSVNDNLRKILGSETPFPKHVKGITSTINRHHTTEHIAKSFLRQKHNVFVNKDGTVRYDMIEMGLTHFKAKEIGTSIEKLKELGYTHDYDGNELENDEQIIEILPQDVILPDCVESGDELASDYIINTANYVDELLEKLYKIPRFYNFKSKEDTIGHLLIGLAPHTSAGIVGRIIGYSKTQGCFSHPVWHAAQRRNLDGDENGILLLMDGLINFSREYLPDRRGSRSVSEDTVFFFKESNEFKVEKIGDFIDKKFKDGFDIEEDGFETLKVKNLEAISFDEKTNKANFTNISKLIRHKNDKKVFEIKTSDGWIKTTEDHSIFSLDFESGKIIEKKAIELQKGDFILGLNKFEFKEKNFEKFIETRNLNFDNPQNKNRLKEKISLDEDLFYIIGFILAEGYINEDKIEIGNTNKKIIDEILLKLKKILGVNISYFEDKRKEKYSKGVYYRINLPSNFVRFLKYLGLKEYKSREKEIPDLVFKTSKENIESFLKGFLDGDGTSYLKDKNKNFIRLYSSSIKLASGLSFLGFLINKKSSCRKSLEKRKNYEKYEVIISDFKKRSSFWSIYHLRKKINEGLKKSKLNAKERNSFLSNICKNSRLKTSSKNKINLILEELKKCKENKSIISILENILNGDLRLELVNEVKEIEYGEDKYVYDLEVPEFQNFLCGPHPIFAHNTMDVSLVLTSHLYLDQIDDEVHGMDIVPYYPLEFYRANKEYKSPKDVKIEKVSKRVEMEDMDSRYLGYKFTHTTDNMNDTIMCSSYKSVPSMGEKLDLQLGLARKIRAVNENTVGSYVIDKHFMKDIKGNLRKFSMQTFRCTNCGEKYRRPPLIGKCTKCKSNSINFTIHEGSIKKYVEPSFKIIEEYDVDPYIAECVELVNLRIEGVFGKEVEKQKNLSDFFGK